MQQIFFRGKLNRDVTAKFIGDDYVNAENIIFQTSKQGEGGLLRLYNGFLPIEPDPYFTDYGKVLGTCEDKVNSALYYFTDQNTIWRYNQLTETREIIFQWSGLNLTTFIQSGIIGDFLYWTDNINQPRYINVTRTYTNVTEDDITLIRPAPLFPLRTSGFSGYATFSSLQGYGYQFSYRYVYLDNQISVIAPWTQTFYVSDLTEFISVVKPQEEDIPKYVRVVELLVRRNDENFWQIFSTVQPSNFSNSSFFFSGDQLGRSVASIETTKPFESIPLKSKCIEIARDRVFLANNLEGYDLVEMPSLKAELIDESSSVDNCDCYFISALQDPLFPTFGVTFFYTNCNDEFTSITLDPLAVDYICSKITPVAFPSDRGLIIKEPNDSNCKKPCVLSSGAGMEPVMGGTLDDHLVVTINLDKPTPINANFNVEVGLVVGNQLAQCPLDGFTGLSFYNISVTVFAGQVSGQNDPLFIDNNGATVCVFNILEGDYQDCSVSNSSGCSGGSQFRKITKFKNRSQYRIGVVFYDRYLRNAGVYTNNDCIVTINDDFRGGTVNLIKWSLNSSEVIPDWAESYQIVRTDNLTRVTFLQGMTSDILWVYFESGDAKYSRTYRADAEFIEIDISGSFKAGQRYNFTQGDRIDIESNVGVFTYNIIGFSGSRLRITPISNDEFSNSGSPVMLYYEIYTPRFTTEDVIFYEVGDAYKIINAGTPNRLFSVTEGFLKGDVTVLTVNHFNYPSPRTLSSGDLPSDDLQSSPATIIIESRNPDNNPDVGWIKDIGRPNAVLDLGQVRKDSAIRYSNRLIQGTRVNGTSSFDFGDEELVGLENGQINRLALVSKQQREGTVMLCICEQEALSIYLGETQIVDNEGGQVVGSTQRVIGTIRGLAGGFGTKHGESVVTSEGRAWWWDEYAWRVVRYDTNGLRPISDIGMKSYFYGKNTQPVTGYDPFHQLFFIGFEGDNKVISFDESENAWRSFYDFFPDFMGKVNEFMVSFKGGIPYRSNHSTLATYFDSPKDGLFEFYTVAPKPEMLENVCLYLTENVISWSNGKQVLDNKFFIEITNEKGQATSLMPTDFDILESVPYAHVLRDVNSGGLLQGEEMRNDIHKFTLNLWGNIGFELLIINKQESSGHI